MYRDDPLVQEAYLLLQSVKANPETLEERMRLTSELSALIIKKMHKNLTLYPKLDTNEIWNRIIQAPEGKPFLLIFIDLCSRNFSSKEFIKQVLLIMKNFEYTIPHQLPLLYKILLLLIRLNGETFPKFWGKILKKAFSHVVSKIIYLRDKGNLEKLIENRKKENIKTLVAYLDQSILGKEESHQNVLKYLEDISNPKIEALSIRLSNLMPHSSELSLYFSKELLEENLKILFRKVLSNPIQKDGKKEYKLIIFEMETYATFHLTIDLFQKLLQESEFYPLSFGITLQSYLPEAFILQQEITEWAKKRQEQGGAFIYLTLTKGSYLEKEQVTSSKKGWPQPPYTSKVETDAQFKKMLGYGLQIDNVKAVHLSIATHNVFDISYALLLIYENDVLPYANFQLLENRLPYLRPILYHLLPNPLSIYIPVAYSKEIMHSPSYLIRRIAESSGPDNFLSVAYNILPYNHLWQEQEALFIESCKEIAELSHVCRHIQNKYETIEKNAKFHFINEPFTDFSLLINRQWAENFLKKCTHWNYKKIPIVIGGKELFTEKVYQQVSPSEPEKILYDYCFCSQEQMTEALQIAVSYQKTWEEVPFENKNAIFSKAVDLLREAKEDFIQASILEQGKILVDADNEISQAIDAIEYARICMKRVLRMHDLKIVPKGTIFMITSRSEMPIQPLVSALISGCTILLKPAPNAFYINLLVCELLWKAGVPKEVLHFVPFEEEKIPSWLNDHQNQINLMYAKCRFGVAHEFLKLNPQIPFIASCPGRNMMIITCFADLEITIKHLVKSAFSYSGQKYSSMNFALVEKSVFKDPFFQKKLLDLTQSLTVGLSFDIQTQIPPLISLLKKEQMENILQLKDEESWLLTPKQSLQNPHLWSPGIKWNVHPDSLLKATPILFPLLSVICVDNLTEAIDLANQAEDFIVDLHSLDPQEHMQFLKTISAHTCSINHQIADPIVQREPFGGGKKCTIGPIFKEGGPNFLFNFMNFEQQILPENDLPQNFDICKLHPFMNKIQFTQQEKKIWQASISSYSYWWERLKHRRDDSKIIGQDNFFGYEPKENFWFRITPSTTNLDLFRIIAAALICKSPLALSYDGSICTRWDYDSLMTLLPCINETDYSLYHRIRKGQISTLRLLEKPSKDLAQAASIVPTLIITDPVLANGRIELLHYLKEITISYDYYR
jgi:RHH-type proline utilization regulon transcriptional repressor/proline dehydrogenase/delta 1-pyrroline-5-carboxylate dehydrogenase